jgi:hypothetical protein
MENNFQFKKISDIKDQYKKIKKLSVFEKIALVAGILLMTYFVFLMFSNPLVKFAFSAVSKIILILGLLVKPFLFMIIIITALTILFSYLSNSSLIRSCMWFMVLALTIILNNFGAFGNFEFSIFKIGDNIDFIFLQIKLFIFYYAVLLMAMPNTFWWIPRSIILFFITLVSLSLSWIPVVGNILQEVVNFSSIATVFCFTIVEICIIQLHQLGRFVSNKRHINFKEL